ncbi:hypothetical protein ES319_A06G012500v1 [Gossypium barbadense]|uniref:NAC domain-containing protein n=2 Tax=Gossypium TaxID=3633 RepID=A0A5J5V8C4_GOSBA|nr:hypothetical protein ES319_A06G012500v1 [Gossypium barbadense]TYH11789.1 hypothetical protein ES288_A06G013400v1 [Gossypium darwinii]KAB2076039.1 hypothetical protein ES319_A06G012500v1 [Gossypium barbadense]KAB2076040.1 hypothetical protein ES319_A06G012500v1 [Gossypium barbadense]KAB2076041.1 hypothetical protein ES319_A06G012500v1 [Gossypium barbadense]
MIASAASLSACIAITSTNEELFIGLDKLTSGSPLPCNVIEVNPYSVEPQYLPDGIWFLISSNDKTDMEHGLWKVKEEAREVFSNSDIIGWRATLVYYKGQVPHEHKTNWVMQVFSTTQKRLCDENANKETISMCRVFLVPSDEMQQKVSSARIGTENHLPQPPILDANCSTGIGSSSNRQVNKHDEKEGLAVAGTIPVPEHQDENDVEMDCFTEAHIDSFSRGDFLEMNDLINHVSSSSSGNSSAPSMSSDECFDSMAFLQDLDQDLVLEQNDIGKKLDVSASNRLDEVVLVPATLVSVVSIEGNDSSSNELLKTTSSVPNSANNNEISKHATGNQRDEGPSSSSSSSSSVKPKSSRRKRDALGRMKELRKKYLCFMPF